MSAFLRTRTLGRTAPKKILTIFEVFEVGNATGNKLEVGEWRSPASHIAL